MKCYRNSGIFRKISEAKSASFPNSYLYKFDLYYYKVVKNIISCSKGYKNSKNYNSGVAQREAFIKQIFNPFYQTFVQREEVDSILNQSLVLQFK